MSDVNPYVVDPNAVVTPAPIATDVVTPAPVPDVVPVVPPVPDVNPTPVNPPDPPVIAETPEQIVADMKEAIAILEAKGSELFKDEIASAKAKVSTLEAEIAAKAEAEAEAIEDEAVKIETGLQEFTVKSESWISVHWLELVIIALIAYSIVYK